MTCFSLQGLCHLVSGQIVGLTGWHCALHPHVHLFLTCSLALSDRPLSERQRDIERAKARTFSDSVPVPQHRQASGSRYSTSSSPGAAPAQVCPQFGN